MRFVRYQTEEKSPRYGWLLDDKIGNIEGDLFGEFRRLDATIPLDDAKLLACLFDRVVRWAPEVP